ncbi:MAG: glycosyltransferase family 4 protein [Alphaproteobacteria bacterium]|nr:glycosyltransferase family 4 protein [Alphaproteobacteria bacterium]
MKEKVKILFDAEVLVNALKKNASRSGIFFASYQIAKALQRHPDVTFSFYCEKSKQFLLRSLDEFNEITFYPYTYISSLDSLILKCRHNKVIAKKEKRFFRKTFWHYGMLLVRLFAFVPNTCMYLLHGHEQENKNAIFFSPFLRFPQKIFNDSKRKKYILLYDAIPLLCPEYYPGIEKGKYWLLDVIKQLQADTSCHCFSISESTKNDFLRLVPGLKPEQITVTPLACAESFHPCPKEETIKSLQKYGLPTDKKYVFSLCSLEPRKNLIRAVKTFIEFIKKNKIDDMVFILGGGHWEEFIGKLDAEIADLGDYKDKIIKAGYIDDEDLAPLYSGAEWFVYTSQYEGFGLPPLEAMACGCPVITSNNSSLPEVVADAGIMIDWDNDEQHIKAYEDYYNHPELREQMRQKGLARAKQFSWDKTADLMVKEMLK